MTAEEKRPRTYRGLRLMPWKTVEDTGFIWEDDNAWTDVRYIDSGFQVAVGLHHDPDVTYEEEDYEEDWWWSQDKLLPRNWFLV